MRKLNGVVIDIVAPDDPEVLWINPKQSTNKSVGIFICEAGVWKDLTEALGARVTSHQTTINALPTTYAPISIVSKVNTNENNISNLTGRVETLESYHSQPEEPEEPGA